MRKAKTISGGIQARLRRTAALTLLPALLGASLVLGSPSPAQAHCGCHGTLCSDVSKTISHCVGEIDALKNTVASQTLQITQQANVISTVTNIVTGIRSTVDGIVVTLVGIANEVAAIASKVTLIPGVISDFFTDLVHFISGFHPSVLYQPMIDQFDESACSELPARVNSLDLSALPDFPFKQVLPAEIFSLNLPNLVGIDPPTATPDDLLRFQTFTDTPIQMLLDITELPYKLPVGFAAGFSEFCINATELYLDENDELEALHAEIHHGLALRSGNRRRAINALHQLPAAHGGVLEEVRYVVANTIDQFIAAGETVERSVIRELDRGDEFFQASRFRESYRHYQKAYTKLTSYHDRNDDRENHDREERG